MNRDHRDLHVLTHSFPTLRSSDLEIREQIKRVHEASFGLYGARKVWHQMRREGIMVAKCTVERLMRAMGLAGVRRGKKTITTISNPKAPCPLDKVNRAFRVSRPNALWFVDFTYVNTDRKSVVEGKSVSVS